MDTYRQEKDLSERQQRVAALMNAATNALQNLDPDVIAGLPQAVVDKARQLSLDRTAAEVAGRTAVEIARLLRGDHGHLHPALNLGNAQLVQASLQTAYDHISQRTKTAEEAVQVAIRYFLMGRTQAPLLGANTSQHTASSTLHTPAAPAPYTNPGSEGLPVVSAVPLDIASAQHLIPSTTQVMKNLNTVASMTTGFGAGYNSSTPPMAQSGAVQLSLSPRRRAAAVQREAGVAINITSNGHLVPADMDDDDDDEPSSARQESSQGLAPVMHSVPLSAAGGLPIVKTVPLGQQTATLPSQHWDHDEQPDAKRTKLAGPI